MGTPVYPLLLMSKNLGRQQSHDERVEEAQGARGEEFLVVEASGAKGGTEVKEDPGVPILQEDLVPADLTGRAVDRDGDHAATL